MKKLFAALVVCALSAHVQAQSINDLAHAWLVQHSVTAGPGDYATCQSGSGADQICSWNTDKLGAQPTTDQLQALTSAWTSMQQAAQYPAIVGAGIVVTGNATIAGTYGVTQTDIIQLTAVISGIAAGQGLPGGGPTFYHRDKGGAPHSFSSDQIVALAKATENFVYLAQLAQAELLLGQSASWPSNAISIP